MGKNRDDFAQKVKEILYKRAGYICSNPDCRANTLAPSQQNQGKAVFLGKAAHIAAAAKGGPRYDDRQTPEERSAIDNAIFLCTSCADLIDKNNGIDYPVSKLIRWKSEHEKWVSENLNKPQATERIAVVESNPNRDAIVARAYWPVLSLFLVKFRMNLHCLLEPPIEPSIDDAFHPGADILQTAPDLSKITDELLRHLFSSYDFSKPMINFTPHDGLAHPTNIDFLLGELMLLKTETTVLLSKYASTSDTRLIENMELIINRVDNLIGPFGISPQFGLSKPDIDMLIEFFRLLIDGFHIIETLISQKAA